MNKIFKKLKFAAIFLALSLLFASCSSKNDVTTSSGQNSNAPKTISANMEELLAMDKAPAMEIEKKGEKYLKATPGVADKILMVLKKSVKGDTRVETGSQYEQDYDYKFKYDGFKEILFSKKDQQFFFTSEKQIYVVQADISYKLDNLDKNQINNEETYSGIKEQIIDNVSDDLNGDNEKELIMLVYNGDLELRVNEQSTAIMENISMNFDNNSTLVEKPSIKVINIKGSTNKKVCVPVVFVTNKIGSSATLSFYDYQNNTIKPSFKLDGLDKNNTNEYSPKFNSKYDSKQKSISLEIPEMKFTKLVKLSSDAVQNMDDTKIAAAVDGTDKVDASTITSYSILDDDKDGNQELVTERIVYAEELQRVAVGNLKTYYKFEGEKLVPAKIEMN